MGDTMPKTAPRHPSRTIELSVEERYALARMQPLKGSFVELTMSKNLIALLELQHEEAERWHYAEQGKGRWVPEGGGDDPAADLFADITFSEAQNDRIKAQLEAASSGGALEMVHVRLYEVFVRGSARAAEDAALRKMVDQDDEDGQSEYDQDDPQSVLVEPESLEDRHEVVPLSRDEMRRRAGLGESGTPPERQFVDGQKQREEIEGAAV